MKKAAIAAVILTVSVFGLYAHGSNESQTTADGGNATEAKKALADTDGDSLPDTGEKLLGTNPYNSDTDGDGVMDKEDTDPAYLPNPFQEEGTTPLPLEIIDARVENNYHADDHLEITLRNTGKTDLSGLEVYFTITDKKDSKIEAYYVPLVNLNLTPGTKTTIHFDNGKGPGHYPGNPSGLYETSPNGLDFNVVLSIPSFQFKTINVVKDPGTAEIAD